MPVIKLTQIQTRPNIVVELENWVDLGTIERIIKPNQGIGCSIVFGSGCDVRFKEDVTFVVAQKEAYDKAQTARG